MLLSNSSRRWSALLFGAAAMALASCVAPDGSLAPRTLDQPKRITVVPLGNVVISQVYGGGGNSGALIKNDYIELFNNSNVAQSLTGFSVQYASATGTTWQVTNLTGVTLQPGQYYLVQEALGAGGTVSLTPDVTGTIAMSATAGKVALVNTTTALTGSCPTANVVDFVGFGPTANCSETAPTAALSNTTAAIRNVGGSTDSNNNLSDFTITSATTVGFLPRNTASPLGTPNPGTPPVAGDPVSVTIAPATPSIAIGATQTFTPTAKDVNGLTATTTYTWLSSDPTVASISISGVATALKVGTTNITATSANNVVSNTVVLTVTAPTANITIGTPSTFASPIAGFIPVGYQAQVFAGGTDLTGPITQNTQVNWTSLSPSVATVSSGGVITAVFPGTATITATSKADGVTVGSRTITTFAAADGVNARIGHNLELGTPVDADPSDDYIIARKQYTLSYNPLHGGPNWVSWNLDASHKGGSARCNCFSQDPQVAAFGFPAYDTNDWINGGVYSRGHMSPSADWADIEGDNAGTYFLSNMLPQNQTMNGGVWGALESDLRARAVGTTEIYIISGPVFTKDRTAPGVDGLGFLASITQPGKIAVPDSIWKIAIVVPDARDGTTVSRGDVEVIATMFPNNATGTASSATNAWLPWKTTIAAIQRSTGYNFLSLIPEAAQCKIEVRCLPVPAIVPTSGSNSASVGVPYTLKTSATDAGGVGGGPWTYLLEWGDGTSFASGMSALPTASRPLSRSKVYDSPGTYTVRLTITDKFGGVGVQTYTVIVGAPAL
jgi:DNA/RNA endonuclease G (NUC1)